MKKLVRFIGALVVYGLFWFFGYQFLLRNDEFGTGKETFYVLLLVTNIILSLIACIVMIATQRLHYSFLSFLSGLFGLTVVITFIGWLFSVGASTEILRQERTYLLVALLGIGLFFTQIGIMIWGKRWSIYE
jgi:hypothetical protein